MGKFTTPLTNQKIFKKYHTQMIIVSNTTTIYNLQVYTRSTNGTIDQESLILVKKKNKNNKRKRNKKN